MKALETMLHGQRRTGVKKGGKPREEDFGEAMLQEAGSASVLILNAGTQLLEIPPSLPPKPHITRRMSATRASWLFVSQAGKLNEKQKQHIRQMIAGHPDLA